MIPLGGGLSAQIGLAGAVNAERLSRDDLVSAGDPMSHLLWVKPCQDEPLCCCRQNRVYSPAAWLTLLPQLWGISTASLRSE